MKSGIIILCEDASNLQRDLIGHGVKLASVCGAELVVLLLGRDGAEACIASGADRVLCLDVPEGFADDALVAEAAAELLAQERPHVVLSNATIRNRAIMPMIAAILGTGLTADCTGLSIEPSGALLQTRPAYGNHLMATVQCASRPQMATVRPGIFPPVKQDSRRTGDIRHCPFSASPRVIGRGYTPSQHDGGLTRAEVIVSGGVGIGSREGFEALRGLAEKLHGSLGATRGAVNAGFAPYEWQVGQTGVVVRPKLYIAVGISGAVQHIAGMSGAETVIAINSDRKAPIFGYADVGVVADWREAVDNLDRYL